MNIWRYLKGELSFDFPHWQQWSDGFSVDSYWSGRILYFRISRFRITLDCRDNWVDDMMTGTAK